MLFNSITFIWLFLPISFFIYFTLNKFRFLFLSKIWILFASLFFYAWWNVSFLWIIVVSIVVNFFIGKRLSLEKLKSKKVLLILGIIFNVALLGYFKYTNYVVDSLNDIFNLNIDIAHIALPLAISFFTFQQIAYLVDAYKGYTKEYDFLTYVVFVTFFPQLIAGPIVHHKDIIPQFKKARNLFINYRNIFLGIFIFTIGLFKKVVVADTLAYYVTQGFDVAKTLTFIEAWVVSLCYTFQLYFDFSGYCDMAMGAALLFNIKLPVNFNSPYKATNIQDFWRRWHITLSSFLRDYLYIPLGGSRLGKIRTYFNLFIVFVIGGIWHGAGHMFVLWGIMHGLALVIHRIWLDFNIRLHWLISWFITFIFINCAWVVFRAKDWDSAKKVFNGMIDIPSLLEIESTKAKVLLAALDGKQKTFNFLIGSIIICFLFKNSIELIGKVRLSSNKVALIYGSVLAVAFIFTVLEILASTYSEFIYFNF